MTDPEQGPAPLSTGEGELAEALREARRLGPNDAQVASLAARLGRVMGPGGGGGGGPGGGGVPAIAKWAAAAVVLVSMVGSVAWIGLGSSDASPVPSAGSPPMAEAEPSAPEPAPEIAFAETAPHETETEVVVAPSAERATPTVLARDAREAAPRPALARADRASAPVTTTTMTATPEPAAPEVEPATAVTATAPPSELSLLEGARAALRSRPEEALALADRHRALYPTGSFAQERELLAIEALVRMRRRPEAQRRVEHFRASWPASVHEPRLSVLMAD